MTTSIESAFARQLQATFLVLVLIAASAARVWSAERKAQMTVEQARVLIAKRAARVYAQMDGQWTSLQCKPDVHQGTLRLEAHYRSTADGSTPFEKDTVFTVLYRQVFVDRQRQARKQAASSDAILCVLSPRLVIGCKSYEQQEELLDALSVLAGEAWQIVHARVAKFLADLPQYRDTLSSGVPVPEEARRPKVQADAALSENQKWTALDLYMQACYLAPWWASAQYNSALIAGDLGLYYPAIERMNYYLKLMPDAPNAREAQDQVYRWEALVPPEPAGETTAPRDP